MKLHKILRNYKKLLFIILLLIIIPLFIINKSYASDESNKTYKPEIIFNKNTGDVTIIITSVAASTNTRYRSIGFTITTQPSPETAYAKGIKGPSAPIGPYKELYFDNATTKKEIYRDKNIVKTEYHFNKEYVKQIMKQIIDLDKISETTILYFHTIFETYQIVNGKEIILTPKITTWQGIVNDQPWKDIDVFKQYFNMEIPYDPGDQDNTLHFIVNGTDVKQVALDKLKIGEPLTWDGYVNSTYEYKNKTYSLVGYYVRAKLDDSNAPDRVHKMIGDKINGKTITAEDIINDSVNVLYGGMDVYMLYEKKDVTVRIHAADIDTDKIIKENLYVGTVQPGAVFEKSIDKVLNINGITYKKTRYFYYYLKSNEARMTIPNTDNWNDDDPIKFTAYSDIDSDDEIIVIAYYKKASGEISITVNAINKDTGQLIKKLYEDTAKSGDTFSYKVEETITSGEKAYNFTGEWKWKYTKNSYSAPTITNQGTGVNISFKVPSADEIIGGITVNVYYKPGEADTGKISLRVIMVSKTGSLIQEISKETVTRGQAISKSIQSKIVIGNVTYQYMNKWDYTYKTSSGNVTKPGSGDKATFKIPSETELGTVITLKLYYDTTQSVEVPEQSAPIILPVDSPSPYAVINGDKFGAEYFISKEGISTTESQYVYVKTKEYLLGYRLVNRTGKIKFTVPVTMTYTLEYKTATPEEYGGPKDITDTVTDTQYITVERAYSYWEIERLEYYIPNTANVYNYSLPNEGVSLSVNTGYLIVPSLVTRHSSNLYDHITLPKQATEGIQLTYESPITSDDGYRPDIETVDLTSYAWEMTDELTVKNDYIMFGGKVVMSDTAAEKIAPVPDAGVMVYSNSLTNDKVLFKDGLVIDAKKENGVNTSNGNVTYIKHPMSVNAQNTKLFTLRVNNVVIHTPVICDPVINDDNDKWVQLLEPAEDAYHIVLDPDTSLNDFTVRISNKLPHSARHGYYERDFSRSFIDPENVSYIAKKDGKLRNEMKLPFDVFMDVNSDNKTENDELIKAGTWIILDRETYRFYVPMWVKEGVYTAEFRTVAVNGEDKLSNTETTRNSNINNYVATATRTFQISGRVYGFTLYDISDDGLWKDVFRVKDTMLFKYFEGAEDGTKKTNYNDDYAYYYTVGTKNQYGLETGRYNKYTLPLINGSHPKYKNAGVIKTGYAFRFMLDTTGEMYGSGCRIRIVPTFYHVDENGENRQLVDIYYDEEIYDKQQYLVKIGEGIDLVNLQKGQAGNPYSRIPEEELKHTAEVMGTTYASLKNQIDVMYSYNEIRITSNFRTFIGTEYAKQISKYKSYGKIKEKTDETELSLSKYVQRWYGTYKLPTNIHVVPKGYDVYGYMKKYGIDYGEDFWIRGGYIIVNFRIETYDKNGQAHLSYTNGENYLYNGNCSMWVTEGAVIRKTDNKGVTFDFKAGDVVLYYVDKKHTDDYNGKIF